MLLASHRLPRVRMLLRSLVRHIVLLRMHPADFVPVVLALFPLSLPYVTRHISRVGGVLDSGISDSWFFRW